MDKEKSDSERRPSGSMWPFYFVVLVLITILYSAYYYNRFILGGSLATTLNVTPIEVLHPEYAVTRISPSERRYTRKTVNLRRGPGTVYEKVGSVPGNTTLRIIGVSGDWYLTQRNGREVFIAGWLTYDLPTATPVVRRAAKPTVNVRRFASAQRKYTHGILNIRSGPGTSYRRVGQFGAGEVVVALGRSGDWYLIKHNGRDAFVASWLTYNSPPSPPRAQQPQTAQQQQPAQSQPQPAYSCNCNKTCPYMSSCQEAYFQLNNCGCRKRDGDNDGIPCENICPGG